MPALYTLGAIIGLCFMSVGKRADDLSDKLANGDWPHVPEGMRPARKSGRGESEQGGRAVTCLVAHHDKAVR